MTPVAQTSTSEARRFASLLLTAALAVQWVPMFVAFVAGRWQTPLWWGSLVIAGMTLALVWSIVGWLEASARVLWVLNIASSLSLGQVVDGPLEPTAWQGNFLFAAAATSCLISKRTWHAAVAFGLLLGSQFYLREQELFVYELRRFIGDLLTCLTMAVIGFVLWEGGQRSERSVQAAREASQRALAKVRELEANSLAAMEWDAFIHDEVLSTLTAVANRASSARGNARRALSELAAVTSGSPRRGSLVDQLLDATLRLSRSTTTKFSVSADAAELPPGVQAAFVEAASELLRNIAAHAWSGHPGASALTLSQGERGVRLIVQDFGVGFSLRGVEPSRLGLAVSVFGRMQTIGGSVVINSRPGHGTRVELSWPREVG